MQLLWSDEVNEHGRKPWLLFWRHNQLWAFDYEQIAYVAHVKKKNPVSNGRITHTEYTLDLQEDVKGIAGYFGASTGTFAEGLADNCLLNPSGKPVDTWAEMAKLLGVSEIEMRCFLMEWLPEEAEHFDNVSIMHAKGRTS